MKRKVILIFCAVVFFAVAGWLVWRHGVEETVPVSRQPHGGIPARAGKPPPLDPVVSRIVNEGPFTPYLKLNYIIKDLSTDLREHDIAALVSFLSGPRPISFTEGEWGSLVNDTQEALSVQSTPSEAVARALIALFRDENQARMLRDYSLQHIGGFAIYLVHTAHTRGGEFPSFFDELTGELVSAAKDTRNSWSGTAMNLLDGILRAAEYRFLEVPGITPESLVALALPAVKDSSAPLNTRLPALQLASRRGSPEAVSHARQALADSSSPLMLVQSAAAVLAAHGTKDDLVLLESLRSQNKPHTRDALDNAIKEISRR